MTSVAGAVCLPSSLRGVRKLRQRHLGRIRGGPALQLWA